jgi:hypothetical protein
MVESAQLEPPAPPVRKVQRAISVHPESKAQLVPLVLKVRLAQLAPQVQLVRIHSLFPLLISRCHRLAKP